MKAYTIVYWWLGILAIFAGIGYILVYDGPTHFAYIFPGGFRDMIEFPLYGTNYLLPILPISAIILGFALLFMERKFGWRALPLLIMGAGMYDITSQWQTPIWIFRMFQGQFWAYSQLGELSLGFLAAGLPKFKADRYLLFVLVAYVVSSSTSYYELFVFALFLYIYKSSYKFRWRRKTNKGFNGG